MRVFDYLGSGRNRSTFVVSGDFNLPYVDWMNGVASDNGVQLKQFNNFVTIGSTQLINQPTRNDTILHLLFSNDPMIVSDLSVDVPFNTSDHISI